MEVVINYNPNPKQTLFHQSPCEEVLYGGSKGGGKSCALVMECFAYALEYPGSTCYLFRETFDDLESNLIREFKEKIPKELYTYQETKHVAFLSNGSQIYFRYVTLATKDAWHGRSMDFLGIDELTRHDEDTVQTLMSCLRSPKGFPPRFRATCNPGGIGHVWVRDRYINPTRKGTEIIRDEVTGGRIQYIPATVYDNDILMQNDPSYVKRLENLPEHKRRAFLYGDWDFYEGQAFEEFSQALHVIKPFPIPKHWRKWRSVDNGYTDNFAWYWFTVDEEGTVYVYREYTRSRSDEKVSYSDQARKVVELSKHTELHDGREEQTEENIDYTVCGHDAWNSHPLAEKGKTIIDFYHEGGLGGFIRAVTDRRLRKATWHEYLRPSEENMPKLKIFNTCRELIRTLPLLIEDEDDPEKVMEDSSIDHWYDAAGYGLIAHHAKHTKPLAQDQGVIRKHKDRLAKQNLRFKRRF